MINIIVSNGLSTGHIRPAGRRDVMVTIQGLNFNTPDGLVMEYIKKYQLSGAGGTRSPPATLHRLQHLTDGWTTDGRQTDGQKSDL